MNILERFRQSPAWDNRYKLPLVPQHNNPFIYCAYSYQMMMLHDPDSAYRLDKYLAVYVSECMKEPGLYYRWPVTNIEGDEIKRGGAFSYDEIVGLASMSPTCAKLMYNYLKKNWGCYDNGELPEKSFRFFRFNQYRFPFLMPYLKACQGMSLNWADKSLMAAFLKSDACQYKQGDEGGRLRIWLMSYKIQKQMPESITSWRKAMDISTSPKKCFAIYFSNHKLFEDLAPPSFEHGPLVYSRP